MTDVSDLKLRFLGSLVEQLGAQMYPSATATIAELISNAWDADAKHVWVTIPLGQKWSDNDEIVVVDDGHGMTHNNVRDAYLHVGRKRRVVDDTDVSPGGRLLHGRKGIGKLAAFGTARSLDFLSVSQSDSQPTRFRMDYEDIRRLDPTDDYQVGAPTDNSPLTTPDGTVLNHGTRVRLSGLRLKRALNPDQFLQSMARRFAILSTNMEIAINGKPLARFDVPVQFRFPPAALPAGVDEVEDGWAVDHVDGERVKWWVGFTEKPLRDEGLLGISVLARGKLVQRPFLFQRAQGATGQLGQQYLVGEVQADWLDSGRDIEDDHIQANRDQLQLENDELQPFVEWGQQLLKWALSEWNAQRKARLVKQVDVSPELSDILQSFTPRERTNLLRVRDQLADAIGLTADDLLGAMQSIANAYGDSAIRQMWDEIDDEAPDVQSRIWRIIHDFGLIDARRNLTLIRARLDAIDRLKSYVRGGATEVPTIHEHVKEHFWLIDPRWHLLSDEVDLRTLGIDLRDQGTGKVTDFMFALRPSTPASYNEVLIVEIKRGSTPDGNERRVDNDEVDKFHDRVLAAEEHFDRSTVRPNVRGLMIAQAYTRDANRKRRSLEGIPRPVMEFRTWNDVIEETERLHRAWLEVESRRAIDPDVAPGASA